MNLPLTKISPALPPDARVPAPDHRPTLSRSLVTSGPLSHVPAILLDYPDTGVPSRTFAHARVVVVVVNIRE